MSTGSFTELIHVVDLRRNSNCFTVIITIITLLLIYYLFQQIKLLYTSEMALQIQENVAIRISKRSPQVTLPLNHY
jgi:hypothetical protein